MSVVKALQSLGYSKKDAQFLAQHDYFHHKRKTEKELRAVFQRIADAYDCDIDTVKKAVMKYPVFAGYDHKRVVNEATEVYGDRDAVKRAVMKFSRFAGYDHKRVLRERSGLGELIGLTKQEVIEKLLEDPVLSSYSAKRYIAALDVGRKLAEEGFTPDREMVRIFFRYRAKSPYVPGTKRKRISRAKSRKEPPLLKEMRKRLLAA